MPNTTGPDGNADRSLTDRDDSVLIVIDVQQPFVDKLAAEEQAPVVNRIAWIVKMAATLSIPIVATAEDITEVGFTVLTVAKFFPGDTMQHDKMTFGLAGNPTILSAVEAHRRRTAVIVGFETDVCVMQSALGLLERGFRVVVLSDATASPGPCHDSGITRMRDAGAIISTVKGTFYEWIRTLDFADEHLDPETWTGPRPDGVYL